MESSLTQIQCTRTQVNNTMYVASHPPTGFGYNVYRWLLKEVATGHHSCDRPTT